MKLTYAQLEACAKGAVIKKENADGSICLRRMTPAQEAIYPVTDKHRFTANRAAGITLDFYTDSATLLVTRAGAHIHKRNMDSVDVLVDGKMYRHESLWMDCGEGSGSDECPGTPNRFFFLLPPGEKRVTVAFQHAISADSVSAELEDGASFRPYTHTYRMLALGDSITQGFAALHPAQTYVSRLGRLLDAEVFNHGISGERFRADKITGEYPDVDFVTVAYGTNDFGHMAWSMAQFMENMQIFMEKAARTFAKCPIFVLLPVWRVDDEEQHNDIPTLQTVRDLIAEETKKYPNMTVIDCKDFIPHEPKYFEDASLHPNNMGMGCYAEALYEAMQEKINNK